MAACPLSEEIHLVVLSYIAVQQLDGYRLALQTKCTWAYTPVSGQSLCVVNCAIFYTVTLKSKVSFLASVTGVQIVEFSAT